ncbi:hypothetical protein [Micromonospora sp. NPDC005206]|uniref:hypothetical protein n=1 Tax=Micromonospora sp. NPDC005206 TaxID=3157022 RepID=UPI0033B3601B
MILLPPLAFAITAPVVLTGIATSDAIRVKKRPPEPPSPPDEEQARRHQQRG